MAVRREKVVLELEDGGFSTKMARDAAAVALLERSLKSLDGTTVNIHQRLSESATQVDGLTRSADRADGSINQLTGRLRVLGEVAAILAPTLGPLGGVAAAGMAGLASQIGFAAVAGGVLIGSLQGVGDALEAMNKAQLEPTDKNLEKARDALKALSPAAREFAQAAFDLKPALVAIRDIGAESLVPGLTESLDNLERLGLRVAGIMEAVGGALGDIAADSTASLASERWEGFFEFIRAEAPDAITELAATVGSLTHGMVELWQAFTPLNDDFSGWLMGVAAGFDQWATGLSATEGFAEFVDYIRTTGPQVAETFGAIFNAVVQLVQASAPLGGPVLAGIEAVANAIAAIADSDLGTPIMVAVGALSLLNRTLAVTASLSKVSLSTGLFAGVGTLKTLVASGGEVDARSPLGQLRAMPAAMKDATAAQEALVAAQKRASGVTAQYVGQLQAVNSATARGFKPSMQTLDRLTDSLDQVHLANNDVEAATIRATTAEEKRRSTLRASASQIGKTAGLVGGLAIASSGAADQIGITNTVSLALAGSIAGPLGTALGASVGLLLDWRSAGAGAEEQWRALEATLQGASMSELNAQLAESVALRSALDDDSMAAGVVDRQIAMTRDQIEKLGNSQKFQATQSRASALALLSQTGANVDLAKWSRRSTEDIEAQAKALTEAKEAARTTAGSFVNLGEGLNDSKVSLGDWIQEMADSAIALEQFTANSRKAAKRGLDDGLIASLQEAGVEGALRMRQLANATNSEIDKANAAFRRGERAMESYVDFKVPPKKILVETATAERDIRLLEGYLRGIKDEDVFVNIRHSSDVDGTGLGPDAKPSADGTFVPKTGKPYADRHLYLLADGEGVTTNRHGETDRFRDVITGINAGYSRSMVKGMLADGGIAEAKLAVPAVAQPMQLSTVRPAALRAGYAGATGPGTRSCDGSHSRGPLIGSLTVPAMPGASSSDVNRVVDAVVREVSLAQRSSRWGED